MDEVSELLEEHITDNIVRVSMEVKGTIYSFTFITDRSKPLSPSYWNSSRLSPINIIVCYILRGPRRDETKVYGGPSQC